MATVLATKRISTKIDQTRGYKPASVSLFFVNGNSDSIKIVANAEGIQALKEELELAEKAVRKNRSYFLGDPLWMNGQAKLISVEPVISKLQSVSEEDEEEAVEKNNLAPRIFWISVLLIMTTLMVIGGITICKWLF
jgi:hypothetical protein